MAQPNPKKNNSDSNKSQKPLLKKLSRKLFIYIISLAIVIGTFTLAISLAYNNFLKPVDENDPSPIEISVPMGTSVDGISEILYENNLIRNAGIFKLAVDFSNKANDMQAGKYILSKDMTYNDIIDELMTGQVAVEAVKITIREGTEIKEMASTLVNDYKLDFTEEEFIQEAKDIEQFKDDYSFLKEIPEGRLDIDYPLEGYLFPETYYVYADDTPREIIRLLLDEFKNNIDDKLLQQAKDLDMTLDNVVTLASIIQGESKDVEFTKVSAVFHNRLNIDMKLDSDATVNYILPEDRDKKNITIEDTKIDSPYNTYKYAGLPIGPICSPGKAALEAAVNPYEEYMDTNEPMLYFVLMDPVEGLHAFNSTYEGHIADKNKYQPLWD